MRLRWIAAAFSIFLLTNAQAQKLMGIVVEKGPTGQDQPLPGANVYWQGTNKGTTTRENGVFMIDRFDGVDKLIVSFVGYTPDTLTITNETNVKVELHSDQVLQEVTVEGWKSTSGIDHSSGINVVVMNEKELFKAACCNLSESFETNPSVDVAFTDAVTGTRQIQMLGLSGPNTMISLENMPGVRGLASSQGIQFIPGTWINSIQVTKGVGSVVNGYESIAGQINVELKKPQESDKLYLNGYVNNSGRSEMNFIWSGQTSKKWATTVLLHGSIRPNEMDQNKDSFLDFPTGSQVNLINRWVYNSGNGWLGQMSFKVLKDDKQGGQTGYNADVDKFTTNRYGLEINTDRYEFTGKLAYSFPLHPYKSVGLQVNGLIHNQDSYYGMNLYDAKENSVYANLIYQSIIGSTMHKFKTGLSFLYDDQSENLNLSMGAGQVFNRTELVPGAFVEYNYDDLKKFSMIAGARVDMHNLFGVLFVPRLHLKYDLTNSTSLRASGGRGIRVANIIAENSNFLVSSRAFMMQNLTSTKGYGFRPDNAWNAGVNLSQDFELDYRPGVISVDYFYTTFKDQVVVDYDQNAHEVHFTGLQGKSFSHSFQAQIDYQLVRRLDLRIAYRRVDVETDYLQGRLSRPLIPKDRSFVNLAYRTKSNWSFDYTVTRIGPQRIPGTSANPTEYQLPAYSEPYWLMNAQFTKDFAPKKQEGTAWSVYVGVENITNFRLDNPIIGASDPFGPYFDSSMVWGPVFGRMFYGGFRYRIK
ncbi:MAG TPA: TonB-dependent receptor [Cyclobacteriaceae bacterium]|nr:TonB-dependent receptor [Cyclobacteriaceae bacterium]